MTKANSSTTHRPANRLSGIALSEIVQISERARQMRAEGRDVIALSTGEPDFPIPPEVIEAAHQAALARVGVQPAHRDPGRRLHQPRGG